MKRLLLFFFTLTSLFAFEQEVIVENSNFISAIKDDYIDYNRFRVNYNALHGDFSMKVIVDNDTFFSNQDPALFIPTVSNYNPDIPFNTSHEISTDPYDRVKLYRAFIKYEGAQHSLNLGLQRVAFGVGRIWTPVDMFNPLQSLSLESSERAPVLAANYNYVLGDAASITTVVSQQENK
ncbi:MAG: hypothetical protein OEW60_07580, partial [Thiovulaceae bacterium]|nr:hypothetical protein [Sulfurimonadaceae bacterium]